MRKELAIVIQLALGVLVPLGVATAWVLVAFQGFHLFRPPTPQERAWELAGIAMAFAGYALVGVACVLTRRRWPVFAVTAAISGLAFAGIQIADAVS